MRYDPLNPHDPFNRAMRHADHAVALAGFGMILIPLLALLFS